MAIKHSTLSAIQWLSENWNSPAFRQFKIECPICPKTRPAASLDHLHIVGSWGVSVLVQWWKCGCQMGVYLGAGTFTKDCYNEGEVSPGTTLLK